MDGNLSVEDMVGLLQSQGLLVSQDMPKEDLQRMIEEAFGGQDASSSSPALPQAAPEPPIPTAAAITAAPSPSPPGAPSAAPPLVDAAEPARAAAGEDKLTAEQEDSLSTFMTITGSDAPTATQYLEALDWSLDGAVGMFMEAQGTGAGIGGGGGGPPLSSSSGGGGADLGAGGLGVTETSVGVGTASASGGGFGSDGVGGVGGVNDLLEAVAARNARIGAGGSTGHTPGMGPPPGAWGMGAPPPLSPGAVAAAAAAAEERQAMYPGGFDAEGVRAPLPAIRDTLLSAEVGHSGWVAGQGEANEDENVDWVFPPPQGLSMNVTFQEARQLCKEQGKWLIVNLQDSTVFASHELNRDVWTNETVETLLRSSFSFWQRTSTSSQGSSYAQKYRIDLDRLPVIDIIDPRTGKKLVEVAGYVEPEDLVVTLMDFLDNNSPDQAKAPKLKKVNLSAGVYGVNHRGDEADDDIEYEYEDDDCIVKDIDGTPAFPSPTTTATLTPPMPDLTPSPPATKMVEIPDEPPAEAPSATKIQLRAADGKTITRRFLKENLVAVLFAWATKEVPEGQSKPFELMVTYPKKKLSQLQDKSLEECDLHNTVLAMRWLS
ncbi:unnamed protein product [Chrysoparadoxa australica]